MILSENTLLKNGKYRIVRSIGQGGYGVTYLATTTEEVRGGIGTFPVSVPVAIKEFFVKTYCVRDILTGDVLVPTAEGKERVPRLREDFEKEAKSMAQMDHPNIVKVIDIFEDNQTLYYVMQYLDGSSLADLVGRTGAMPVETARRYIFQVAGAVAYLHEQHVCHFDIKPSNIMITNQDMAVLIDFGISRHYDGQGISTTSRPVGYSGGFSSPEQRMGDILQFSPSSDIYSLAATLYYMLSGKAPTDNNMPNAAVQEECPTGVSPEMWKAVAAGMETDKNLRPPTVKEWLSILDDTTATKPIGVEIPPEQPPTPIGEGHDGSKRGLPKNLILFIAIIILVIIIFLLFPLLKSNDNTNSDTSKHLRNEVKEMRWNKKNHYGNTYVYTGVAIDNIPNGYGKAEYSDGSIYEGNFRNGLRDGSNAIFTDPKGNRLMGTFSNDTIVRGRITAKDGSYYEGLFSDDKPYKGSWYDAKGNVIYHVEKGELIQPN